MSWSFRRCGTRARLFGGWALFFGLVTPSDPDAPTGLALDIPGLEQKTFRNFLDDVLRRH